jgi:hypothetical protein
MTELTPEEKRKIYEEEKFRLGVQEKLKKKKGAKNKQIGCLILIILVVIVVIYNAVKPSKPVSTEPQKPLFYELNASVHFDGAQYIISNNDDFDWTNVKLEVNAGLLKGGYVYNVAILKKQQTYTIGSMQFAKGDGTRFNPYTMKAINIDIWCDTPKGKGAYHGKWD